MASLPHRESSSLSLTFKRFILCTWVVKTHKTRVGSDATRTRLQAEIEEIYEPQFAGLSYSYITALLHY